MNGTEQDRVARELALARTDAEVGFLSRLLPGRSWLMVWPKEDADGTPWLCVSCDMTVGQTIVKTLRADFDGSTLRGGWSPACLNWDDGVRAVDVPIDSHGKDGINRTGPDGATMAEAAAAWFDRHWSTWSAGMADEVL